MRRLALILAIPAVALAQAPLKLTLKNAERIAVQQSPRIASARFSASAAGEMMPSMEAKNPMTQSSLA